MAARSTNPPVTHPGTTNTVNPTKASGAAALPNLTSAQPKMQTVTVTPMIVMAAKNTTAAPCGWGMKPQISIPNPMIIREVPNEAALILSRVLGVALGDGTEGLPTLTRRQYVARSDRTIPSRMHPADPLPRAGEGAE